MTRNKTGVTGRRTGHVEAEVEGVFSFFKRHKTFTTVCLVILATALAISGWAVAC